jgi:hypothetical protein
MATLLTHFRECLAKNDWQRGTTYLKWICLCLAFWDVTVAAQDEAPAETFNAEEAYNRLSSGSKSLLLFPWWWSKNAGERKTDGKKMVEDNIAFHGLVEVSGLERGVLDVLSGNWAGVNETGRVSLYIEVDGIFGGDRVTTTYWPPSEQPMSDPILTHLISGAAETIFDTALLMRLVFPKEAVGIGEDCWSYDSMTIRVTTGALRSRTTTTECSQSER